MSSSNTNLALSSSNPKSCDQSSSDWLKLLLLLMGMLNGEAVAAAAQIIRVWGKCGVCGRRCGCKTQHSIAKKP
jgi:hypothetical protein